MTAIARLRRMPAPATPTKARVPFVPLAPEAFGRQCADLGFGHEDALWVFGRSEVAQDRAAFDAGFFGPPAVHFVGFRGEEYWSAVKIWGRPDFFHRVWDERAAFGGEMAPHDTVVFAREWKVGSKFSFNDSEVF